MAESSYSVVGRSYDTLMPRYWSTLQCIWDYFLSSPAHVLLDPDLNTIPEDLALSQRDEMVAFWRSRKSGLAALS